MPTSRRPALVIVALALAAGVVLAAVLLRRDPGNADASTPTTGDLTRIVQAPHLLFRHSSNDRSYNHLGAAPLADPEGPRAMTTLRCERVAFRAGRGICLAANRGMLTSYEAVLFDAQFQPLRSIKLEGAPSRTRISPDGRYGAITVFAAGAGHSYVSMNAVYTKTILLAMETGEILGDLEQFATFRGGQPFKAEDFNFWGVTFANDNNTFYATLLTGTTTYLVRGDITRRTLTTIHENVECPAISPDNQRIAYKKRVGGGMAPWRFHVLDLATMTEQPIDAETRSIDDQLEWLDDKTVLYGAGRSSQSAIFDVWKAPVTGNGPAERLVPMADSPVVVR